ncbi:hypothetical protein HU675_0011420 [Bradyrhizobium septentrionale]|uniref:hypothetical protein n=1 Tax=Bradyrhizobium septentrionale TaxID=1404411 RepID=UPI0015968916|nr:hypothetical protein [Bradyrhizobium septentrionale]UGY27310.1 hypothetical protein HU675_0011420 [Bradyrhizobium septentrionale]
MKFILLGDWPCNGGALLVPADTVIEWDSDPERARIAGVPTEPQWNGTRLPLPMPINAKCMDQAAYDQMVAWYSGELVRRLQYDLTNVKPQ